MKAVLVGIAALGAGYLLLRGKGEDGDAFGGGGGGFGEEETPGEGLNINFPELDLTDIWGDTKKDNDSIDLPWGGLDWGGEGRDAPSSIPTPVNFIPISQDFIKKDTYSHHRPAALPTPESLGLTKKSIGSGGGHYSQGALKITKPHGHYSQGALRIIRPHVPNRHYSQR